MQYTINDFSFSIRMTFEKDDEKSAYFTAKVEDEKVIHISCFNILNAFGNGGVEAIEIGTINNKKLFLRFWVSSLGSTDVYRIDYTLYGEM